MTQIEYLTKTWNLVTGCSPAGPGCLNCFAARNAATRLAHLPQYAGLARYEAGRGIWTGEVRVHEDLLFRPTRWRKSQVIGVAFSGDLFHHLVPDDFIERVWIIMKEAPQHVFIVLTKRIERALQILSSHVGDPLPNVILMTSAEDQTRLDQRVPVLLQCPAAVRGLSLEPMLGEVDLSDELGLTWERCELCLKRYPDIYWADDEQWAKVVGETWDGLRCPDCFSAGARSIGAEPVFTMKRDPLKKIDWVIAGAESGHRARPLHPDGPRTVRDQCAAAGVPFWWKGWGEWAEYQNHIDGSAYHWFEEETGPPDMVRVGKKRAGNLLDGERWEQAPALIERVLGGRA